MPPSCRWDLELLKGRDTVLTRHGGLISLGKRNTLVHERGTDVAEGQR